MPWVFTYNDWSAGTEYDYMVGQGELPQLRWFCGRGQRGRMALPQHCRMPPGTKREREPEPKWAEQSTATRLCSLLHLQQRCRSWRW